MKKLNEVFSTNRFSAMTRITTGDLRRGRATNVGRRNTAFNCHRKQVSILSLYYTSLNNYSNTYRNFFTVSIAFINSFGYNNNIKQYEVI